MQITNKEKPFNNLSKLLQVGFEMFQGNFYKLQIEYSNKKFRQKILNEKFIYCY